MPSESALRHGNGNGFGLIETMRWDPALGYVRLEYHLERLHRSAHELAFAFDPDAVREALRASANPEFPPRTVQEVILCNERGEVCEGTITNVFVDPGGGEPWLTPAIACGLLPGVLRGELIDLGKAREAVLTPGDLSSAGAVYVGNSLRGLISTRLD